MGETKGQRSFSQGDIYTLAQSGTASYPDIQYLPLAMVYGKGSLIDSKEVWRNRARRKMISQAMVLALIDVAKEKGDDKRVQAYWNTYHCLENLTTHEGRAYGKYCKNRFCSTCLAIRKAEIINKYLPVIEQWEEPYFVTLTVKAQPARNLEKWMGGMKKAFQLIHDRCKKRHQRGKGVKLIGIKSLECNFNPKKKTYNPHYHLIVANKAIADTLLVEWQKQWNKGNKKLARPFAQHRRKVNNLEHDLIEIIKYGSKIFTEPDVKNKAKAKRSKSMKIYAAALDNILVAMKPYRLFDRFGFNLPKSDFKPNSKPQFLERYEEWVFDSIANDWVNPASGELFSGFIPDYNLNELLVNNIDAEMS